MSRDYQAMIAVIEARSRRAFGWRAGRDCVSFAAACIAAQTGHDPLADVPRWKTRREALAVAEFAGGLVHALDARLTRIPPALAKRGDIAGLPDPLFGVRLMVIEGETLVGPGTRGLERLPRSAMVLAWSIDAGDRSEAARGHAAEPQPLAQSAKRGEDEGADAPSKGQV